MNLFRSLLLSAKLSKSNPVHKTTSSLHSMKQQGKIREKLSQRGIDDERGVLVRACESWSAQLALGLLECEEVNLYEEAQESAESSREADRLRSNSLQVAWS